MIFSDLPAQATVFLDTNVFVYHFSSHPTLFQACRGLLKRVENGELSGVVTTHQLSDLAHRPIDHRGLRCARLANEGHCGAS
jgi:predicted nucleic acid-binding protein